MKALMNFALIAVFVAPLWAADNAAQTISREVIAPGKCLIRGTATDTTATPLPNRSVRLRNLETSAIEQTSTTDRLGAFNFVAQPDIPYVVEIVETPGRVVGVGPVVLAHAGEVAGSPIVVPAALPAYAGAFKGSARAVVSALGGLGIVTLTAAPPISPEQ
jgi:hypothetical protein